VSNDPQYKLTNFQTLIPVAQWLARRSYKFRQILMTHRVMRMSWVRPPPGRFFAKRQQLPASFANYA
jgi:hypothetical protein